MSNSNKRTRNKNTKQADAIFSYIIPLFFMVLAGYQQVTSAQIDKYVIGALLVFGLGALGWRIDVLAERYWESKRPPQERE